MTKPDRKHPILGKLHWDDRVNSWEVDVEFLPGIAVNIAMVAEAEWADADPVKLFDAGAAYLVWSREAEPTIRNKIADDLHACYNESWADEDPNEGTPPMDRADFLSNIHLSSITLYHDGGASWFYTCGDLFAGHGIDLLLGPDGKVKGEATLVG